MSANLYLGDTQIGGGGGAALKMWTGTATWDVGLKLGPGTGSPPLFGLAATSVSYPNGYFSTPPVISISTIAVDLFGAGWAASSIANNSASNLGVAVYHAGPNVSSANIQSFDVAKYQILAIENTASSAFARNMPDLSGDATALDPKMIFGDDTYLVRGACETQGCENFGIVFRNYNIAGKSANFWCGVCGVDFGIHMTTRA